MLLDLSLPDASGLELLREIRNPDRSVNRVDPALGVIIVSGRGTERDRIRGLGQGADDYVQKPYSYGELLARINSVLRRKVRTHPVIRAGEIEINAIERTVKVAGRPVLLSAKEFGLLNLLATEPTRVFSKEELLQEVWGYRSMSHTRTLEAHCSRLRRKLDPDGGRYVVNCWGERCSIGVVATVERDGRKKAVRRLRSSIRESRGAEGDSFISPSEQRATIEKWANLRGVEIAEWHEDLDQSGGKLIVPALTRSWLESDQVRRTG